MTTLSIYEMKTPSAWASAPSEFSFSSLVSILECPRRWQLLHSQWGDHTKFPERIHPAAIEGRMVHEAIDMLTRKLGQKGRPPIGSRCFCDTLEACGFWTFFEVQTRYWNNKMARHPKTGPYFVLRSHPRDLANRAIRFFRQHYREVDSGAYDCRTFDSEAQPQRLKKSPLEFLCHQGALSEVKLRHPDLPFIGYIDLVRIDKNGNVSVIDFKSGGAQSNHEMQVRFYAVLWWRCTETAPDRIELRYLDHAWSEKIYESKLLEAEKEMSEQIESAIQALSLKPAAPVPGHECARCAVRARCDEGWAIYQSMNRTDINVTIDVEVEVLETPTQNGFLGKKRSGDNVSIVYQQNIGAILPEIEIGELLRIIDAVSIKDKDQIEIKSWTEVFKN